jgi:hypothetical protein
MDRYRSGLTALLAVAVLAGCGGGGGGGGGALPGASPSAMSDAQLLVLGKQLAQCIREHGVPGLPDPTVENGRLILPDSATANVPEGTGDAAMKACQSFEDKLPASALGDKGDPSRAPMTAADLAQLRRLAQCVRQQGLTDFPDPGSDGSFDLTGTSLAGKGNSQRVHGAVDACKKYSVGGMHIKAPAS